MEPDHTFTYELRQYVKLAHSKEAGQIVARAEYLDSNDQYLLRYKDATGRQVENWWSEAATEAV